jgi:bacteriocin biosynthesis cyclodehydratase domain-containing protein
MGAGTDLPELPLLAPWYRLVEEGDAVVLEHGHRAVVLEGRAATRLLPRLLPLLDGTRSLDEIASASGCAVREPVSRALALLAREGLLVEGPRPEGAPEACETAERLAAASDVPPATVCVRLAASRVGVAGSGSAGETVARLLLRGGVGCTVRRALDRPPAGDDLVVVAPASDELPGLDRWNEAALAASAPWIQLLPFDGRFAAVGPLYLPGETACFACYRLRRAGSLGFGELDAPLERVPLRAPAGPALTAAAAAVAADNVLRWLALADPQLPGILHALADGSGLRLDGHRVLRVPRCPACSAVGRRAPAAPWFEVVT